MTRDLFAKQTAEEVSTIWAAIVAAGKSNTNKPAIYEPGKACLKFGELIEFVEHIAHKLNILGIKRNDRVCLVAPNGAEMATAFLAVTAITSCAPLNANYSLAEFTFYLNDLQAKALIVPLGMETAAEQAAEQLGIRVIHMRKASCNVSGIFEIDIGTPKNEAVVEYAVPEDVALVLHTSGTTGRPKIVPLTQKNITVSVSNIINSLSLTSEDRSLNVMPLFHVHGLIGVLLTSLMSGGTVVCTRGFDTDQFMGWVSEFAPTWYSAVPTMHQAIAQQAEKLGELPPKSLRFIRSSSSALPPNVADKLEEILDVPIIEAYSMTEAAHQMTVNPLIRGKQKRGSAGKAAFCEVAIMDEQSNLLSNGQIGEIVVRGKNVVTAYENNLKANEDSFTNGWFRTGDQGYFDEEGYLFISGRTKEIINRGGEKIFPREVDELLLRYSGIRQVAAFAIPHPTLGEDLAAVVVMDKGKTATAKEIRQFAAKHIAAFKVPSQIFFAAEIPKGPTGKIQRVGLADKLADTIKAEKQSFAESTEPLTPLEQQVVQIWREVFELPALTLQDDYFNLGGTSIQAMQILNRLRNTFSVNIKFTEFFDAPTIGEIAEIVRIRIKEAK